MFKIKQLKYVLIDVGCIECSEPSKVIGVYEKAKEGLEAFNKYCKNKKANNEPASAMKIFFNGEDCIKNGQLYEASYFEGGQHSIELYAITKNLINLNENSK